MSINDNLVVKRENLEKIRENIKVLKVMIEDKDALKLVNEVLEIVEEDLSEGEIPLKDKIKDKMIKTETTDPDLNFKLYMLYRKLNDGKIDEVEAAKYYELYTMMMSE